MLRPCTSKRFAFVARATLLACATAAGAPAVTVRAQPPSRIATTPDAPPIAGQVVIGTQSRIVIEPGDENVNIFYLLEIQNTARAPVNPPAPFVIDVPTSLSTSFRDVTQDIARQRRETGY